MVTRKTWYRGSVLTLIVARPSKGIAVPELGMGLLLLIQSNPTNSNLTTILCALAFGIHCSRQIEPDVILLFGAVTPVRLSCLCPPVTPPALPPCRHRLLRHQPTPATTSVGAISIVVARLPAGIAEYYWTESERGTFGERCGIPAARSGWRELTSFNSPLILLIHVNWSNDCFSSFSLHLFTNTTQPSIPPESTNE